MRRVWLAEKLELVVQLRKPLIVESITGVLATEQRRRKHFSRGDELVLESSKMLLNSTERV